MARVTLPTSKPFTPKDNVLLQHRRNKVAINVYVQALGLNGTCLNEISVIKIMNDGTRTYS